MMDLTNQTTEARPGAHHAKGHRGDPSSILSDQQGHRFHGNQQGHRFHGNQQGHRFHGNQQGHRFHGNQQGHRFHGNQQGHRFHGNQQGHGLHGDDRAVLTLNVLLLGDMQSGRSSVGNALIGGHEFQTGGGFGGVPVTTELLVLGRTFPDFFRRKGAESDLRLRVVDTPPLCPPRPPSSPSSSSSSRLGQEVSARLETEDVHVVVLVAAAHRLDDALMTSLTHTPQAVFGPRWSQHALLVLTHADRLREAGLQPHTYLSQASDSLRLLIDTLGGGYLFVDNSSDWPVKVGKPLRDRLLDLSASNHHLPLKVKTSL